MSMVFLRGGERQGEKFRGLGVHRFVGRAEK